MTLQTKTFAQVVQDQATAVQGGTTRYLVDFSIGSILRAVIDASAATVMWLQGLILQLLATTRAATASGSDLDTWMADYGMVRLPAVGATGQVTFARFTPTLAATIPIGSMIQTADGTQQYFVIADTTQPTYTPAGYVLSAGTTSASVTVSAVSSGSGGNASAGAINTLGQSISGIDTVSNAAAFITGANAETDAAFRLRFVGYIASLSKATKSAIGYAIASLQSGLTYTLTENYAYSGAVQPGYFYVVVDDGTGSPSSALLATVTASIDAVRAAGITFAVFAPTVLVANVTTTITTAAGYSHSTLTASVQAAITAYIAALPMGASLSRTRLYQVAYDVSPGITMVSTVTVNGLMADLAATAQNAIIPGTIAVT